MIVQLHKYFRKTFLSGSIGIITGSAVALFLHSLLWITQFRQSHSVIIVGLPFIGFGIGWVYYKYGQMTGKGQTLIFEEIAHPKNILPMRMAPLIFLSTIMTHLFGGSAGREGTAVQIGAALSDQLSKFFKSSQLERAVLLMAGTGAGFAAAVGAPWAGAVFGMEVIPISRIKFSASFELFVASFVSYYVAIFFKTPHSVFPKLEVLSFDFKTFLFVTIGGACFGIATRIFIFSTRVVKDILSRFITYPPLKPFFAGIVMVLLFCTIAVLGGTEFGSRYSGLGIESIQESFLGLSSFQVPVLKTLFTSLTVGSGFKGGEFIPLVFIGSTLGSALSLILPISIGLLASLGFVAVFAGASKTPIACAIMAMELFGYHIGPYALVACFVSYYVAGSESIYKS